MGQHVSRTDFEWSTTDQPHTSRRTQILAKYPQIKKLFRHDPLFKWDVTLRVLIQITTAYIVKDFSWSAIMVLAYCFGGVINHSLVLAIHDISHNAAFGNKRPLANRLFGIFANLPVVVPFSIAFKRYHVEHHRYLGDEKRDTDLPTWLEAKLFCTTLGKFVWMFLQPLFYALRPLMVYPKTPNLLEILNTVAQVIFNLTIWYCFGGKALIYLLFGTFITMGLHPMAGHFISEHYMFEKGHETYSYYGPFNLIMFNVGYHNEHHDFPAVPSSKLPEVKKIAEEFYDRLPHHDSFAKVVYDFIVDPAIGPYARIKRKNVELSK